MQKRFSQSLLFAIRNRINIEELIVSTLQLPSKSSEGYQRFLCPDCHEFRTACNTKTNLARCFLCARNFNTIDIVITVHKCSFVQAVQFLQKHLPSSFRSV